MGHKAPVRPVESMTTIHDARRAEEPSAPLSGTRRPSHAPKNTSHIPYVRIRCHLARAGCNTHSAAACIKCLAKWNTFRLVHHSGPTKHNRHAHNHTARGRPPQNLTLSQHPSHSHGGYPEPHIQYSGTRGQSM
eukprot:XP_001691944.1 predicted protein [Chlamydomonas reinhardtii]